jgi:hypothetical protein
MEDMYFLSSFKFSASDEHFEVASKFSFLSHADHKDFACFVVGEQNI